VEVSCPHFEYALAAYYLIMPAELSSNLARFDAVRYGEIDPTFEQDVWMRDLADAIHRTQPAVEPALAEVPVHGRGGPL